MGFNAKIPEQNPIQADAFRTIRPVRCSVGERKNRNANGRRLVREPCRNLEGVRVGEASRGTRLYGA